MNQVQPPLCMALLREELLLAAARRHQRGRPVVVAVLLLVAMVTALLLARPVPARADVRVEVQDGRVAVTLVDLEHRPRQIEAVLRGVGLDASVSGAPVGPSEVGRFVGTTDAAGLAPELLRIGAGPVSFAGFSVPVGWDDPVELHVGRPAAPDEDYAVFSDALAPGEPLACRRLLGLPATRALQALAAVPGLEVVFQPHAAPPLGLVPPAEVRAGAFWAWTVSAVEAASATRVIVRLVAPAAPPPATTSSPRCPA